MPQIKSPGVAANTIESMLEITLLSNMRRIVPCRDVNAWGTGLIPSFRRYPAMPNSLRYRERIAEVVGQMRKLRQSQPELLSAFGASGIAISCRCDDCIGFPMQSLIKLKATREAIEAVAGVAVYMGGGRVDDVRGTCVDGVRRAFGVNVGVRRCRSSKRGPPRRLVTVRPCSTLECDLNRDVKEP